MKQKSDDKIVLGLSVLFMFLIGGSVFLSDMTVNYKSDLSALVLNSTSKNETNTGILKSVKNLCVQPPSNLVSWWTGDTNYNDIISSNNGVSQTNLISSGYVGQSFHFNGTSDYIKIPNHSSLTPATAFTYDFWVKPETAVAMGGPTLIYKSGTYEISINGNNITFGVQNGTKKRYITSTNIPLTLNNWNFVAVTYNGPLQETKIYINGTLANTVVLPTSTLFPQGLISQSGNLTFGYKSGVSTSHFKGSLDEIELFNRALTLNEIQSIYNAGGDGKCKCVPNTWTQKADVGGVIRASATGFSIGIKGYIGTGEDISIGLSLKDFWEYDSVANIWTPKADLGGVGRSGATGFSIGSKGYLGTGYNPTFGWPNFLRRDFWEYDPAGNIWTQKADLGGVVRYNAVSFSIGNKGYVGTGRSLLSPLYLKDFWEYDPAGNIWTQKADFGGSGREQAVGFSIGNKGYIGTGGNDVVGLFKDFWEYDPAGNIWTQKADFGGGLRILATGFSIGSRGYIGTGMKVGSFRFKDFWEYDPAGNIWTQKADFGGTARIYTTGFSIGNKGYIGLGNDTTFTWRKDFWEYCP